MSGHPKRVAIVASASGCGKTTVGRAVAERMGLAFHELDALNHGPGWTEATPEELREKVGSVLETESWVIDGNYRGKLGDLVLERADLVVWLDLPRRVWLPRLLRRTLRRIVTREALWGGNRETVRGAFFGRDALLPWSLRHFRRRRRAYSAELERFNLVRLRSTREVERFLSAL